MRKIICMLALILCGCATNSGVQSMGKDTFFISLTDNSPTASLSTLKLAALQEASAHCEKLGQTYTVVGGYDVPRSFGQFPQVEVQFRCAQK